MFLRLQRYLTVLILLTSLVACDTSFAPATQSTIKIGLIAPITGNVPSVGHSTVEAARFAVNEINELGGLKIDNTRYKVSLVIEDSRDNPHQAVHAARKLILQDEVIALIGPQLSRNAIPVAQIAEQHQILMISPWSSHPHTTLDKRFVFRVTPVDDFIGQTMAQFAYQQLELRRAAVLYDIASPYNDRLAQFFRMAFKQQGGDIVAYEHYTTDTRDYRQQLQRIKDSQADGLFLPNYDHEVVRQARQARELGIDAILLGSATWITIPPQYISNLNNSYFITEWSTKITNSKARRFIELYQQKYQKPVEDVVALTYDAFGLLFHSIQQQQSIASTDLIVQLNQHCYEGVAGSICYHGTGNPQKPVNIMQIRAGKIIFHQQVSPTE